MELTHIVEALIFSAPEPLSPKDLVRAIRRAAETAAESRDGIDPASPAPIEASPAAVSAAIDQLNASYEAAGAAFRLVEGARGWRFETCPEFAPFIASLHPEEKSSRLSRPGLETLAIIAYRQPVTRAGMEAIRGVGVDAVLQKLLDLDLVRVAGRSSLPGRPILYGTTDAFMEHFGIRDLDDLPDAVELRTMNLPGAASSEPSPGESLPAGDASPHPHSDL